MNLRRVVFVVLVLVAAALAVLAGIGTGGSFGANEGLWEEPDTAAVEAEP